MEQKQNPARIRVLKFSPIEHGQVKILKKIELRDLVRVWATSVANVNTDDVLDKSIPRQLAGQLLRSIDDMPPKDLENRHILDTKDQTHLKSSCWKWRCCCYGIQSNISFVLCIGEVLTPTMMHNQRPRRSRSVRYYVKTCYRRQEPSSIQVSWKSVV